MTSREAGQSADLLRDVARITQQLIRFPTVNPPGNESEATSWVLKLLSDAGIETRILAANPLRPNLVARFRGRGIAPPVLLQAHMDVVPVEGQHWSHDPFAGDIVDGELWGRGAVDMKGQLAMMLAALLSMKDAGELPTGDVLLVVLADEERGSTVGARYLVAQHRELFHGVGQAIGEDGGAELRLGQHVRLHPVVVAEKRTCWLRVTLRGPSWHASRMTGADSAAHKLHRLLGAIADGGSDVHLVPIVDLMLRTLETAVPAPLTERIAAFRAAPGEASALDGLGDVTSRYLRSLVRHTVTPTVFQGGSTTNVVPPHISVELDCRVLPGDFGTAAFVSDLCRRVGCNMDVEILVDGELAPPPVLGPFYERLVGVLAAEDPHGVPIPVVTLASTDARVFRSIGIQCFGWFPLLQDGDAVYRDLLHCADERISLRSLEFGARCYRSLLREFR